MVSEFLWCKRETFSLGAFTHELIIGLQRRACIVERTTKGQGRCMRRGAGRGWRRWKKRKEKKKELWNSTRNLPNSPWHEIKEANEEERNEVVCPVQKTRKCLLEVSILHATRTWSPCETGKHVRSVSHHLSKPIFWFFFFSFFFLLFFWTLQKDENVIKKDEKVYGEVLRGAFKCI